MIDPKLFTVESLLKEFFDDTFGNVNAWRKHAEIVPKHMPRFPDAETHPRCVVRLGDSFLRYSEGPRQGVFWDMYGDDFLTPELALIALLQAPVPPWLVRRLSTPDEPSKT